MNIFTNESINCRLIVIGKARFWAITLSQQKFVALRMAVNCTRPTFIYNTLEFKGEPAAAGWAKPQGPPVSSGICIKAVGVIKYGCE